MSIVKVHRYGVRSEWKAGQRVTLQAPGKRALDVSPPSDFEGGVEGVWSPEELLIASLATCFELTVIALAKRRRVPLRAIRVDATGHVEHKRHLYELMLLELDVRAETEATYEHELERIAAMAHEGCIVGKALDVPVRLTIAPQTVTAR